MQNSVWRGRCLGFDRRTGEIRLSRPNESSVSSVQSITVSIHPPETAPSMGDWVEVDAQTRQARILTRCRSGRLAFTQRISDPRRRRAMRVRAQVERGIHAYFANEGFESVRTPLLVPCPGMEPHIRPYQLAAGPYLPTSPEFAMKRLLVGGLEKIYQICPAFRREPISTTHHPEFTMLEWYRAFADDAAIMRDVEELVSGLAIAIHGEPAIPLPDGRSLEVAPPWPRLRIRDLFSEIVGVDLAAATQADLAAACARFGLAGTGDATAEWDDLYFKLWMNQIEPRLPADQAVFVHRFPPSQAALAVVDADADGTRWARRFEAYAGGFELANAFEELTDPIEQRARFEKDMQLRSRVYGPGFAPSPLDEGFLAALEEGMPPAAGIALGVDRLVMLFAGETDLDYTLWLPSETGAPDE